MSLNNFLKNLQYRRDCLFILSIGQARYTQVEIEIICCKNGLELIDYSEEIQNSISSEIKNRFIKLENELERIVSLCDSHRNKKLLFYNFDLVLSYLCYDDRKLFWDNAYSRLGYLSALPGIAVPSGSELLPSNIGDWKLDNRFMEF